MDRLAAGEDLPASPVMMYSLVWGPRATFKTFAGWMKASVNVFSLKLYCVNNMSIMSLSMISLCCF